MNETPDKHKLLLDVGGTFIKCSDGRSIPIDSNGSEKEISETFKVVFKKFEGITSVAVAIPGPFDYENGIFLMQHKFASLYGKKFAEVADAPDHIKFKFIHDVNCMLLGELNSRKEPLYSNTALVTIGTGLGFSFCKDNIIQKNLTGSPAIPIYNRPYRDGILEDYVSKRGITDLYFKLSDGQAKKDITVLEIARLAYTGNKPALLAFSQAGHILGESLRPVIEENKIESIVFGGQIAKSFDLMKKAVCDELEAIECIKEIRTVSDFDNTTFKGLSTL